MTNKVEEYHSTWRGQVNRGILEFVCLLQLRDKAHGYDLVTTIRDNIDIAQDISDGPIYALLSRLEKRGILQSFKEKKDGRRRKYYLLTKMGQDYLQLMTEDWQNLRDMVDEMV